jgi:amino acid adenylation domain-containing protein
LSLAEIQLESAPGRGLFDHMLIFENYPLGDPAGAERAAGQPRLTLLEAHDPTHYEFDLTVVPGERTSFKFTFDVRTYRHEQIERTAQHLLAAVDSVLSDAGRPVREIEILSRAERDRVLGEFNATAVPYPRECTLVDLFEEQVARTPDAVALRCDGVELSYRELDGAANRLAHHLLDLGVSPEAAVGVCVERTPQMIVAPLAIMKAGGMFVPLDPGCPRQRLEFMLEDAGIRVLLTQRDLADRLPGPGATRVLLDADAEPISARPDTPPAPRPAAGHSAYAIYTSGSTGLPKGVVVAHRSLTNMALAWRAAYRLSEFPVRLLQVASMSFDVFLGDLARALVNGGMLIVCPADALTDPQSLHGLLARHGISIFESTPGIALPLMEHIHRRGLPLGELRLLIIGSDVLPAQHFRTLQQRFGGRLRLINSYGATETTIDSSFYEPGDGSELDGMANTPVGRPLANTRLYVLDRHGRTQPIGVPGELHIGGDGVARGYLNRAELSAARFVHCAAAGGERVYRSGDLARWLPDGNLELIGRIDFQVKVRGYRIELGEIEGRLLECPSVEQAVVVARDFGHGNELAAYVVAGAAWEVGRTRELLREHLPDYMVPAFFVRLDGMPLSPNGKLDRRALPDPRAAAQRAAVFEAPRTATEAAIETIWRRVLQVERIGVLDDFFELGGHSLKAMQITAQIHKEFGVAVALRRFFDDPSVAALARLVDGGERTQWLRIPPAPTQEHYALSHAQRRLWMLHHMDGAAAYNMPEAHVIKADIDAGVLGRAFDALIQRHESLRTAFVLVDGEPRQAIRAGLAFSIAEFDLRQAAAPLARAREIADADAIRPFDLSEPPLLRASLAHLPGGRCLFVLTLHHIIGDGWSGNLLLRELLALYEACRHGRPDALDQLRIQYKDFANWQNALDFAPQERYWLRQLAGMPEQIALPYDLAPAKVRSFLGNHVALRLDREPAAGLRRLALRRGTTVSNVMLALFELLLFHWTRQDELCVGMSVANRSHPDVENLIGFFVNVLPIRCRLDSAMEFSELLDLVIERTHEALEHQDYPFDLMIEKLNPARHANRQPLVNVIYAFQNFTDVHVDLATPVAAAAAGSGETAVDWERFDVSFHTSKFDLTLFVAEESDTITITLEYDSTLFLEHTIRTQLQTLASYATAVADTQPQLADTRETR